MVRGYFAEYLNSWCKEDRLHVTIRENHCSLRDTAQQRACYKSKCKKGGEKPFPPQKFIANLLRFMERMLLVDKLSQDDL